MVDHVYLKDINEVEILFRALHKKGFKWCDGDGLLLEVFWYACIEKVIEVDFDDFDIVKTTSKIGVPLQDFMYRHELYDIEFEF